MARTSKLLFWILPIVIVITTIAIVTSRNTFHPSAIRSDHPFHQDWEVAKPTTQQIALHNAILQQPFHYIGEGGQSYAFASSDGKYVLKLFKFKRFRPSPFVEALPDIGLLSTFRETHAGKRLRKMATAFSGYRLANDKLRDQSGLLWVQLNTSPEVRVVKLTDRAGTNWELSLENVPYVIQVKGLTFGEVLQKALEAGNLDKAQELIDKLFTLFLFEYALGIRDLDHGIMHNIGYSDDGQVFHLDVGKLVKDDSVLTHEGRQRELTVTANKIEQWVARTAPVYSDALKTHVSKILDSFETRLPHEYSEEGSYEQAL
jgi:hypothetical protein